MKVKGLICLLLVSLMVMSLGACGKDDVSSERSSAYGQTESVSAGEAVEESSDVMEESSSVEEESSAAASTEGTEPVETTESTDNENAESTEEPVESIGATEETKESVEEAGESVTPSKEQERGKPSASTPSVEQTTPSQEASKPSASTPSVEQTRPSAPAVHTCNYGSGSVTKAATCIEDGVKTFTCSCGASKTETIGKTGHNYVPESQAATCSADGYEKTKCSICGDVQSEKVVASTGHNLQENWFPASPDCTSGGGLHWENCTKCDYRADLPAGTPLGHEPDAGTVINAATCTRESLIEHYCTRCSAKLAYSNGPANPNNHDWGFDEEYQVWFCTECGTLK